MKALTTRVGTYVTGDAVADAVLTYALALARMHALDLVEIPFRATSGAVSHVQFRLGWLVDMDAVSQGDSEEGELIDRDVVTELAAREHSLHPKGDAALQTGELPAFIGALEEY